MVDPAFLISYKVLIIRAGSEPSNAATHSFSIGLSFSTVKYKEILSFFIFNQKDFGGSGGNPEPVVNAVIYHPGYFSSGLKDPDLFFIWQRYLVIDQKITDLF